MFTPTDHLITTKIPVELTPIELTLIKTCLDDFPTDFEEVKSKIKSHTIGSEELFDDTFIGIMAHFMTGSRYFIEEKLDSAMCQYLDELENKLKDGIKSNLGKLVGDEDGLLDLLEKIDPSIGMAAFDENMNQIFGGDIQDFKSQVKKFGIDGIKNMAEDAEYEEIEDDNQ